MEVEPRTQKPKAGKKKVALVLGILSYVFIPFHLGLSYISGGGIGYAFEIFSQAGGNDLNGLANAIGGFFILIVFGIGFLAWFVLFLLQTIFSIVQFALSKRPFNIITFVFGLLCSFASIFFFILGIIQGEGAIQAIVDWLKSFQPSP